MRRLWLLIFVALATVAFAGNKNNKDKDKQEENFADLRVKVLKAATGKPIRNAIVVLHAVDGKGRQETGGLNLKTDDQGVASYNGIPYGKLRVQVIMTGFQTYGGDHDIQQPEQEIVVKMEPPQKQYSIYDQPGAPPSPTEKH